MDPWYVWFLGRFVHVEGKEEPQWAMVGIYSTEEKAVQAAQPGDGIAIIPVDDTAQEVYTLAVRWV